MECRASDLKSLMKALGYRFKKKRGLRDALVHRSFRHEQNGVDVDNQRLEFLGDAVLGAVAAAYLYERFPSVEEGVLTTLRSQLTSGGALGRVGRALDLGAYLAMGKGEMRSGGPNRLSNLADALEAVIGAAYLDGGMKAVRQVFAQVFVPRFDELTAAYWSGNPKGRLQELCQQRWKSGPVYRLQRQEGPAHDMRFTVEVEICSGARATGHGKSKQKAEAAAAAALLHGLLQPKPGAASRFDLAGS